jgi:HEAT repeat protein
MLWLTLQQLRSKNPKSRLHAAEKIAALEDPAIIEPLIAILHDSDSSVRITAARALGKYREPWVTDALTNAIQDTDKQVREAIAEALKLHRDVRTIPTFVTLLSDDHPAVRWFAATALESMSWSPGDDTLRALRCVALGKLEQAAAFGAAAIDPLVSVLRNGVYYKKLEAVDALSRIGDARVVKPLIVALADEDNSVRSSVVNALSRIGDTRAVEPLIQAVKDRDNRVRTAAVEGLSKMGDPRAIPALASLLKDESWDVRAAAVEALGNFKDPQVVEPLMQLLKDPDRDTRLATVKALGKTADIRAIYPLVLAMKDDQEIVRQAAEGAIVKIDPAWEKTEAARQAIPELEIAIKASEYWVRTSAAAILKRIVGEARAADITTSDFANPATYIRKETADILLAVLTHEDADLRLAAAEALGRLGHKPAVDMLAAALNDSDEWVRKMTAQSLENLGWVPVDNALRARQAVVLRRWEQVISFGSAAYEALNASLNDDNAGIRYRAAEALGKIKDPRALQPLFFLLSDPHRPIRRVTAEAIQHIGLDQATPAQRAAVAVELRQWDQVVQAGASAVQSLVAAIRQRHEDLEWSQQAEVALAQITDPNAASALLSQLSDQEIAGCALNVLEALAASAIQQFDAGVLQKLAVLPKISQYDYEIEEITRTAVRLGTRELDPSNLKSMALLELDRRGLTF